MLARLIDPMAYFLASCCSNRGYFDSISDQNTLPNDKLRTTSAISLTYVCTQIISFSLANNFHERKNKMTYRNSHLLHAVTFT